MLSRYSFGPHVQAPGRNSPVSQSQSAAPAQKSRSGAFYFITLATIATFAYRVLVPANEFPLKMAQVSSMMFDAFMVAGLVAFGLDGRSRQLLFWVAIAAGIGLILIRFTSNEAWWTGHLFYRLR
jgi:hypothetical protein